MKDGSNIAVIGSGTAGSFFSIFASKLSKFVGKKLNITIFEPKDFQKKGPSGCNRCGGVISERLIQMLAIEGINIPPDVVQRGIDSYHLYTENKSVRIETPAKEKRIAAVYRGMGPKDLEEEITSFDQFLLDRAIGEGAAREHIKIDEIRYDNGKPLLLSGGQKLMEADLVVGAFGVKSQTSAIFENLEFGYTKPVITTACIAEFHTDREKIHKFFGSSIHLFLVPIPGIKFAALIPKGTHATVCILGSEINKDIVKKFLTHPAVKSVFPEEVLNEQSCICFPKMNIGAPRYSYTDRIVAIGDAGSTRLYKDGIGAAYTVGKAAANAAVVYGVGKKQFKEHFEPARRCIENDNLYGKVLFTMTDLFRANSILSDGMVEVVKSEQESSASRKVLSSVLWGMFTGNEMYKDIFMSSINFNMNINLLTEFFKAAWRKL